MEMRKTAIVGTVTQSAAVATNKQGFLPGSTAIVYFKDGAVARFAGSAVLEVAPAATGPWTTAISADTGAAMAAVTGLDMVANVLLSNFMRLNVTAVTAGALMAVVIGAVG